MQVWCVRRVSERALYVYLFCSVIARHKDRGKSKNMWEGEEYTYFLGRNEKHFLCSSQTCCWLHSLPLYSKVSVSARQPTKRWVMDLNSAKLLSIYALLYCFCCELTTFCMSDSILEVLLNQKPLKKGFWKCLSKGFVH